ncbi:hypothetical protein Tco_1452289 [Tanacetum coccineum]
MLFANMRRHRKDFFSRVTPLFPTMVVQAQEEMGEGSTIPTDPHHTPIITQPSSSQPQRKQKSRRAKEKDTEIPQSSVPSDPTNIADEAVNEEPKKKGGSRTHKLKRLYTVGKSRRVVSSKEESLGNQEDASKQGRTDDIDADKDIYLVNVHKDEDMFRVNDLEGDEIVVESEVADKDVNLSVDEVTLAQALASLKSAKVQEKGDVIKEPSVPVSAASTKVSTVIPATVAITITAVSLRPRAKGIVFHEQEQEQEQAPTPIVSLQQPTQLDEELAFKLQAEEDEEERLAREKAQKVEEANIAWDDIQAKKRRKHFAAKRAKEKRNRPPTKAQQRSFMCTYIKNMEGWKPKDLKNKSFANIQHLFDKAMKRVNTFIDMDTELVKESSKKAKAETSQESSSKRAGEALEQESSKKQKVDDDKET